MTPGIGGCYNVDVASYHGKVWMLDVFLKLYHLGRYPPATVAAEAVLPSSGHDSEHDDQVDDAMVNDGHDHMTEAADDDDEAFAADDDNDEYVAEYVPAPPSPLMDSKCPFLYSHNALNAASAYNQTLVLDWWLKTHRKHPKLFPLEYTEAALDNASWCGHVQVLDWWLDSGLELRYSWAALADASEAGQVEVLDWWLRAQQAGRLERDYSSRVLDRASIENHVPVLDWWLDKGELPTLEGKYSDQALAVATSRGHLEVIKWWRSKVEAGVLPKSAFHVEKVVRSASAFARMELLEWVLQEGLLTEEVKKDLVRKLSFADGAEFNEWKPEVREWWVNQAGVVIPAI
ncbi:hypothetical protein BCR44DRAFT_76606 [Catenaria anguillulae PL171]|uniref:Ankyrin repeat-containing domain protein n=1 Tax=Catenaria anguillulae PL171 TaxID=765915 RepID=A0A1Y2HKX1_9FUNG|nr:hypothetical protein BCR44DRAFT_76606 [Catenaria anguillulae PL171]